MHHLIVHKYKCCAMASTYINYYHRSEGAVGGPLQPLTPLSPAISIKDCWAFAGWLPTYLQEQFQLTQGTAGITATAYFQVAALFGVMAGGIWADRWSRRNPRGPILVPAIGLCMAAPGVLLAANANAIPFVILGTIVFGFTKAFADANMMPILCLVADPRYRATGYGVLNLFACIVGGATIYAGGVLRDLEVDVSYIFQFAALSLAVCAILLFFLQPIRNAT